MARAPKRKPAPKTPPKTDETERPNAAHFPDIEAARQAAAEGKPVPYFVLVDSIAKTGKKLPAIIDGKNDPLKTVAEFDLPTQLDLVEMANAAFQAGIGQGRREVRAAAYDLLGMTQNADGTIAFNPEQPLRRR